MHKKIQDLQGVVKKASQKLSNLLKVDKKQDKKLEKCDKMKKR